MAATHTVLTRGNTKKTVAGQIRRSRVHSCTCLIVGAISVSAAQTRIGSLAGSQRSKTVLASSFQLATAKTAIPSAVFWVLISQLFDYRG